MTHSAKHSQSNPNEVSKKIAEIISASTVPLSHRDIGVRLRTKFKRVPDYEVISKLRLLMKDGQASLLQPLREHAGRLIWDNPDFLHTFYTLNKTSWFSSKPKDESLKLKAVQSQSL